MQFGDNKIRCMSWLDEAAETTTRSRACVLQVKKPIAKRQQEQLDDHKPRIKALFLQVKKRSMSLRLVG
jgi:hypothetical protein